MTIGRAESKETLSLILPSTRPLICLVTDSLKLGGVARLPRLIRRAAAAGIDLIQIREKQLDARALCLLTEQAAAEVEGTSSLLLVNGRFDIALACGAAGVHLPADSLPAGAVRRAAGRRLLIGVSTHSLAEAKEAERAGADYIFFGPVFETESKRAYGPPQGLEKLSEVCAALEIPVLAIGGIDGEKARLALESGAAGVAAISCFLQTRNLKRAVAEIRGRKSVSL